MLSLYSQQNTLMYTIEALIEAASLRRCSSANILKGTTYEMAFK